jgi:hypothetical protein
VAVVKRETERETETERERDRERQREREDRERDRERDRDREDFLKNNFPVQDTTAALPCTPSPGWLPS